MNAKIRKIRPEEQKPGNLTENPGYDMLVLHGTISIISGKALTR